MTELDSDLEVHLRRIAKNPSPFRPGIRLHPADIEALPKAEPKPVWAGGGLGALMGTPIFADDTIERGGYEVATREWIEARARECDQDPSSSPGNPETKGA